MTCFSNCNLGFFGNIRFLIAGFLVLTACTSGNCRSQIEAEKRAEAAKNPNQKVPDVTMPGKPSERVEVFKYDGSLQCGMGKPVSLEQMQKDLKEIKVFSSKKKADGMMYTSNCGGGTGQANVFEIDKKDLEAAKKLGFKLWTFE